MNRSGHSPRTFTEWLRERSKPRARARASADRIGSENYSSTASLSLKVVGADRKTGNERGKAA